MTGIRRGMSFRFVLSIVIAICIFRGLIKVFVAEQIDQGGLTLPRDYYLNSTYSKVRDAYLQYMTKVRKQHTCS